jgi:hypothetical protein
MNMKIDVYSEAVQERSWGGNRKGKELMSPLLEVIVYDDDG